MLIPLIRLSLPSSRQRGRWADQLTFLAGLFLIVGSSMFVAGAGIWVFLRIGGA